MTQQAWTWTYVVGFITFFAFLIWMRRQCYDQGVWDGAFNRSLPHVQRAMVDYDPQGALDMLEKDGTPIQPSTLNYAAIDYGAFPRSLKPFPSPPPDECPHGDNYDDCPDCRH